MKTDVTIITPFYKGNKYMKRLFECISLNAKSVPDISIEFILVNDSPDTVIVYDECWINGFRLRILTNESNVGIQQTRINGIRAAYGKFIILLDQDDLLTADAVRTQIENLGDGDIIIANGFDQNPLNYGPIYHSIRHQKMVLERKYYFSIGNMIVSPGQCLIKKTALPMEWMENSIRNNGSDDLLLWLLMQNKKYIWKLNTASIYIHVDTGENVSANFKKMYQSSNEVLKWLTENKLVTKQEQKLYVRRFKMRDMYEGKGKIMKLLAYFCYPDISIELIRMKLR